MQQLFRWFRSLPAWNTTPQAESGTPPHVESGTPQLRIALTISGAIALGAYEAGAMAALLLATQTANQAVSYGQEGPVRIDAIGSASSGSMTGLLAARTLLQGYDPIAMMYRAWVQAAAVSNLLTANMHMPLSPANLEAQVQDMLQPPNADRSYYQKEMTVVFALACLQGLDYQIHRLQDTTPIDATTYMDWKQFTFTHTEDTDNKAYTTPAFASPVAFAIASGANELGFGPVKLDRGEDVAAYRGNGVKDTGTFEWFWYTDGGTLDNEPLGRTLDVSNALDGRIQSDSNIRRLHLLIHPNPTDARHPEIWANPDRQPDWTATLIRAGTLLLSQHLYDDLRRMEKMNAHIAWSERLIEELSKLLNDLGKHNSGIYEQWRQALEKVDRDTRGEKREMLARQHTAQRASERPTTAEESTAEESTETLVRRLVRGVSGIDERNSVRVGVISPLLVDRTTPVDQLLAGEILGSFGGFLDPNLRRSDFQLGFLSVLAWMHDIMYPQDRSPSVGPRDEPYEKALREFIESAYQTVKDASDNLVATMNQLDTQHAPAGPPATRQPAIPPWWRRMFAGTTSPIRAPAAPSEPPDEQPQQPTPPTEAREQPAPTEPAAPAAPSGQISMGGSEQAPAGQAAAQTQAWMPAQLLYKVQGIRTLGNLPLREILIVALVALKVVGIIVYERVLHSRWDRPPQRHDVMVEQPAPRAPTSKSSARL